MTAALWVIAIALLILVAIALRVAYTYYDDGGLEILTEADAQRRCRPEVDRLLIMAAADDTPPNGTAIYIE